MFGVLQQAMMIAMLAARLTDGCEILFEICRGSG
jgi:hypothetical protein